MENKLKKTLSEIKMPPESKARVCFGAKNAARQSQPKQFRMYTVAIAAIALTVALALTVMLLPDSGSYIPEDSSETVSQTPVSDYVLSEQKLQMVAKFYGELAENNPEIHENFFKLYDTFSIELFTKCAEYGKKNTMISPLSVLTALSMVMNGAGGDTKSAIEQQIGMTAEELGRSITAYISSLYQSKECSVTSACSVWIKDKFAGNIRDSFCDALEDIYDSEIMLSPFDDTTVGSINDWCESQTKGKIKKIVDNIPKNIVMMLANALTFEAEWEKLYEGELYKLDFNGIDGTTSVDTMLDSDHYDILEDEECIGFLKNYKGGRYALAVLMPKSEQEDIFAFAKTLGTGRWRYLFDTAFDARAKIKLPCFSADYTDSNMQEKLNKIGYSALTDTDADFSGMVSASIDGSFKLEKVMHSVHIDVTQFGTFATGITVGAMFSETIPQYDIRVNRPFVYAIVDTETGSMLFVGIITDIS